MGNGTTLPPCSSINDGEVCVVSGHDQPHDNGQRANSIKTWTQEGMRLRLRYPSRTVSPILTARISQVRPGFPAFPTFSVLTTHLRRSPPQSDWSLFNSSWELLLGIFAQLTSSPLAGVHISVHPVCISPKRSHQFPRGWGQPGSPGDLGTVKEPCCRRRFDGVLETTSLLHITWRTVSYDNRGK